MTILLRLRASALLGALLLLPLPGAAAQQPPRPRPFTEFGESARSIRDSIVAVARAQVGRPYRLGGGSPERGFDCSGFVRFVHAAFHRELPRTAAQQARAGRPVERDPGRLRPGDLLTFGDGSRVSHIGIYVGDGRFVHASSAAGRVVESSLDRRAGRAKVWQGARRLLAFNDDESAAAPRGQ